MSRIDAQLLARDYTVKESALPLAHGHVWQDQLNDTGEASIVLQNDDPDLASVDYSDIVQFRLDLGGKFDMLVERIERVAIAPGEEHDEVTTLSGRGSLARFEEAIVAQVPFSTADVRYFNFATPELDDSAWTAATQNQLGQGGAGDPWQSYPTDWPDASAYWIWSELSDIGDFTDPGDVYFRRTVTVGSTNIYRIFATADNAFELWVDGSLRLTSLTSGAAAFTWQQTFTVDVLLEAGDHVFAVRATNYDPAPGATDNPASFIASVYLVGTLGETTATNLVRTNNSWEMVAYPADPPGFTAGGVLQQLVDEAKARGALDGLALDFDEDVDTDNVAWPLTSDISVQVGLDLLSIIRQLCETYMDVGMLPGSFILRAWVSRGSTVAASFGTSNLTSLRHIGGV